MAALLVDLSVHAEKAYGSIAPKITPANYKGCRILTSDSSVRITNAPNSASATSNAEPIANPLPIAAVVLPAASRASVRSLAFYKSTISAIPPALSAIGPYASIVRPILIVLSMPNAAREMPYISAR